MLGISTTNARVGGFRGGVSAEAKTIYNRIIADGGVSNLSRLNFFVKGLKAIYGDLANVPVCYDAHWIGYKLGSGTGATAGQAAAKLYSLTVAGDAVQSTAASQPLLLSHNGASSDNYYQGVNVAGNYVSTSATVTAPTQLDIVAYLIASPAHANSNTIISNDGTARNFVFNCVDVGAGTLQLRAGTPFTSYNSTVGIGNINNYTGWIRATYNQNGINGDVTFYTSSDSATTNYNSLNWTQLGSVVTNASTGLQTGTSSIQVGANNTTNNFQGKIQRATISNSIGGAPVVDFNPATYNASTSQTAWTSSTGEVWTINTGTATSGYKGVLVDRTVVQGDGVDDRISVTGLTTIPLVSTYQSKTYYPASIANKVGFLISTLSGTSGEYGTASSSTRWYSNNAYFIAQFVPGALRSLYYAKFKTNAQDFKINNGTSPTITNQAFAGANCVYLFSDDTTVFMNVQYQTFVMSKIEDNPTQVTAMYNLIRSLNNNAF